LNSPDKPQYQLIQLLKLAKSFVFQRFNRDQLDIHFTRIEIARGESAIDFFPTWNSNKFNYKKAVECRWTRGKKDFAKD